MLKDVCIKRQTVGVEIDSSTRSIPEYCRDCDQGKKNIGSPVSSRVEKEEKETAMRGDCGNCPRKDVPLSPCKPPLCWRCQQAAEGLKGEKRVKALAEIREKTIKGEVPHSGPHKGKKRQTPPKEKRMKALNRSTNSKIKLEKGDGIVDKLLEKYEANLDESQEIISLLVGLKKYGAEFEMPKRHIIG
jgi:hypothetical protein